ncbi:hypothetical protein GCM10009123_02710 [Kangiella japonica]|uniref:Uncharacterized protein n=2 Tax=Kangiella japonica TaxID=647384 RepID=A0ABN0STX5_9GAMM
MVPLLGVLLGYWNAFDIIFLYWFENIIIGLFAVARMTIRPDNAPLFVAGGLFAAGFFCLHYGFFTYGHGVFVASFFEEQLLQNSEGLSQSLIDVVSYMLSQQAVQFVLVAMLIAHLIDFVIAYRNRTIDSVSSEMTKPYKRIIVLHIAIILGGFFALKFGHTVSVAVVMIGLKVYFDLKPPISNKKDSINQSVSEQIIKEKIAKHLKNPEIKINGKTYRFDTVEEMVNSDVYKKHSKWLFWLMPKNKRLIYEQLLQQTIQQERQLKKSSDSLEQKDI